MERSNEETMAETGCGHGPCLCAAGNDGFCSGYCEQHGDVIEAEESLCACGHADCAAAA